jgi:hypothetical protein
MTEHNHSQPGGTVHTPGALGSRPVMMDSQPGTASHRGPWAGRRLRSANAPDLAVVAREAVVSFLHDASAATAGRAARQAGEAGNAGPGLPGTIAAEPTGTADSMAWQAATMSLATLDRIEAVAAKVEADIAAALETQAQLQAGAGAAAEAAVRAAQEAASSSRSVARSEQRAKVMLRHIEHYVTITVVLLIIAIIFLIVTASPAG